MSADSGQTGDLVVLEPGDYLEILALWDRAGMQARPEGRDAPEAFRRQQESGLQRSLGIRVEGRLVAVVILTQDGRKGWINRLAVDPVYRHRGYARRLVDASERWFNDDLGIEVSAALIHTHNDGSRALFDALGYEEVDVVYVRKLARPGA